MKKEIWFESWFDTNFYHELYKNRDEDEANNFIENLIDKLKLDPDSEVLDLACGKGRHALKMSDYFQKVTGIDLSKNSINIAKKFNKENLKFFTGDMRNFSLNKKFDFIFNLFTSFGYFENFNENSLVLDNCNKHLKKNGLIVIDYLNPEKVVNTLVKNEIKIINKTKYTISRKIENNFIIKDIYINNKEHFYEKVQLINLEMFNKILKKANFTIDQTFGNYQLDEYDKNSNRLIITALKNS